MDKDLEKIEEQLENTSSLEEIKEIKDEISELKDEYSKKKRKNKKARIISNIIFTILFVAIVIEALLGIINLRKLNNNESPIFCIHEEKRINNETGEKFQKCDLGLYKIVKKDNLKESRTVLKLFFIED